MLVRKSVSLHDTSIFCTINDVKSSVVHELTHVRQYIGRSEFIGDHDGVAYWLDPEEVEAYVRAISVMARVERTTFRLKLAEFMHDLPRVHLLSVADAVGVYRLYMSHYQSRYNAARVAT